MMITPMNSLVYTFSNDEITGATVAFSGYCDDGNVSTNINIKKDSLPDGKTYADLSPVELKDIAFEQFQDMVANATYKETKQPTE